MIAPESIDAALQRLARLHPKSIDLSLDRIEALLDRLGRPQGHLPPTIHLAGTNGKGSTAAFLRAIAEASGERVHVYTSPHLVRFNERIRLAGEIVDDARLKAAFDRVETTNGDAPISFFEATTAAAFLLFAETPADRLILETGLGGRLDATNVLDAPQCTVITPVSLDHQGFLGDTVEQIAGEKAGIIKPGAPLILAPQQPGAREVIDRAAMRLGVPVIAWGEQFRAYRERDRLTYEEEELVWDLPAPALPGSHQIVNAGIAIAAARACGYGHDAVREAMKTVSWPARLQRLRTGTLAKLASAKDAELWLDGGHNEAAGEALASSLGQMAGAGDRPLVLISAFSANKDAAGFLRYFTGLAARVIAITFAGGREGSKTAQDLADAARSVDIPAQTSAGLVEALHDALEDYDRPRIVICGSLYLAGEVLAMDDGARVQSTPG
jgi:dihydrofolate synthase/folylpolyglutamate synthase